MKNDPFLGYTTVVIPPGVDWTADGDLNGNPQAARARACNAQKHARGAFLDWVQLIDARTRYLGGEVVVLNPAMPGRATDACYTADSFFCLPNGGIVASNMVAAHRENHEVEHVVGQLEDLGLRVRHRMRHKLEGSSQIVILGKAALVGWGERGDLEACYEVQELLEMEVIPLKLISWCFHADVGFKLLRRCSTLMACRKALAPPAPGWDPDATWERIIEACIDNDLDLWEISESDSRAYVPNMGEGVDGHAVAPSGASQDIYRGLERRGYKPISLHLPYFLGDEEGGGGGFDNCGGNVITPVAPKLRKHGLIRPWPPIRERLMRNLEKYPTTVDPRNLGRRLTQVRVRA